MGDGVRGGRSSRSDSSASVVEREEGGRWIRVEVVWKWPLGETNRVRGSQEVPVPSPLSLGVPGIHETFSSPY